MRRRGSSPRASYTVSSSKQIKHSRKWIPLCEFVIHVSFLLPLLCASQHRSNALFILRENNDLVTLSSRGHFLKGSSATLGLTKVKDSCEKIQHFGARKDENGNPTHYDDRKFLSLIRDTVKVVKADYKEVERVLKQFYRDPDAH